MKHHLTLIIICAAAILTGCASTKPDKEEASFLTLPSWYTQPGPDHMHSVPVDLSMRIPSHLLVFRQKYELPAWVIYGAVRSLGTEEITVSAAVRTQTQKNEDASTRTQVTNLSYNVSINGIDDALQSIARKCLIAESRIKYQEVLASHIQQRFGSFILYSLEPNPKPDRSLLIDPSISETETERFSTEDESLQKEFGWLETDTHYVNTVPGPILQNDLLESFRKTEEEAIYDMARNILAQHELKDMEPGKLINISIKNLYVTRRQVDLSSNLCVVTIKAPKNGVTLLD
ncbi:hypothetical protein BVX97_04150 [bacterium E08(2017)]|nr:hypothetical protein BVX97_04150 [bacterium E08(2017)]